MSRIVTISAKCSDLFSASMYGLDGDQIGKDYEGYVPEWFPDEHYGDYVILDIDIDSGKIVNWKTPSALQLANTFKIGE